MAESEGQLETEGALSCFFHEGVEMIFGRCGGGKSSSLVGHLDIFVGYVGFGYMFGKTSCIGCWRE